MRREPVSVSAQDRTQPEPAMRQQRLVLPEGLASHRTPTPSPPASPEGNVA